MILSSVKLSLPVRWVTGAALCLLFAALTGRACLRAWVGAGLAQAAREGRADQIAYWLERGADVDTRDAWGDTPLMAAARDAHPAAVSLLLARGANPRLRDDFGLSAARWATLHALDSRAFLRVNGIEIRQVPRNDALQTIALLCR